MYLSHNQNLELLFNQWYSIQISHEICFIFRNKIQMLNFIRRILQIFSLIYIYKVGVK